MKPRIDVSMLRKTTKRQYAVRFVLGACVTVVTGLISHLCGPRVGGLFLAFPVLLPASLTAISDDEGRAAAVNDARGARFGALSLVPFAVVVWIGSALWTPLSTLTLAFATWAGTSVGLWLIFGR
jgi:uncharacterized membrane protein